MTIKSTMTDDEINRILDWDNCKEDQPRVLVNTAAENERERIIDLLRFVGECVGHGGVVSIPYIIDLIKELE